MPNNIGSRLMQIFFGFCGIIALFLLYVSTLTALSVDGQHYPEIFWKGATAIFAGCAILYFLGAAGAWKTTRETGAHYVLVFFGIALSMLMMGGIAVTHVALNSSYI